uniref:Uncharacterized protein n=1 Tax=Odontella aurita TaxID=265563 RepID=A0A7S4JRA9_9STRA|mmetsp:Transcript_52351/g.157121  ORF Transcript_52351/g.157121 Transcript_52351/m.157121 type:complete len:270 (+) Transcript_52351:216-1025(+)
MEAEHQARINDYCLYVAAERDVQRFVLAVIEDTWVCELKHSTTFYTQVRGISLLAHLQSICSGLHALDALALQNEMKGFHVTAEGIPEYINALEDSQKRSARAGQPITEITLVMIASNAMLTTGQFPRANDDWEELRALERTWAKWKALSRDVDKKVKIKLKAAGGSDQPGAANAVMYEPLVETPAVDAAAFEGYFENLAAVAVNEKAVLEQLVAANATLNTTNAELSATVARLSKENQNLQCECTAARKKTPAAAAVPGRPRPIGHGK